MRRRRVCGADDASVLVVLAVVGAPGLVRVRVRVRIRVRVRVRAPRQSRTRRPGEWSSYGYSVYTMADDGCWHTRMSVPY